MALRHDVCFCLTPGLHQCTARAVRFGDGPWWEGGALRVRGGLSRGGVGGGGQGFWKVPFTSTRPRLT